MVHETRVKLMMNRRFLFPVMYLALSILSVCLADSPDGLLRVELPDEYSSGHPTYAKPVRGKAKLVIGFSKGDIWVVDIGTRDKAKLVSVDGTVHGLAADGASAQLACIAESGSGEHLDLLLGDLSGDSLKTIHRFQRLPRMFSCSAEFSPSGKYVAYVVRMNGGRASYVTIVDCRTHSIALEVGPFKVSRVMHYQETAALLCWISDDRAIALIDAGHRRSKLTAFDASAQSGRSAEAPTSVKFRSRQLITLPGSAVCIHKIHATGLLAVLSDMTPIIPGNRIPTPYMRGGYLKYFLKVDTFEPSLVKKSDISWVGQLGGFIAMDCRNREDTLVLSHTTSAHRRPVGIVNRTRDGVSTIWYTLDDPRFSTHARLFSDRTGSYCVYVNKESGWMHACELSDPSNGQWFETELTIRNRAVLTFFYDQRQHIALLECDPFWQEHRFHPNTEQSPRPRELVILPLAAVLSETGESDDDRN